ncbi:MAG TPA: copper resistance protein CopC [Acidimicrobiia bacterium]|nr:copper resistance protein CopC [Acidimicrobiia bacterium]
MSALLALALCVLSPWAAAPAWAHPYLVQTVPGPGVALRDPPPTVQIGFTERVVLEGSSLRLDDGDGRPVALGPLHTPKEGPGLAADIKSPLGGDVYLVRWSVLGDDGHSSSGEFRFGVDGPNGAPPKHAELLAATGGPADQSANSDGPLRIALRWLGLFGASLLVGGAVLLTRLRGRLEEEVAETVTTRWTRLARLAWALTLAGSIAGVAAAAAAGAGGTRMSILLATSTGGLALARLAGVVLAGLPGLFGPPGPRRDQFLGMAGAFFLGAEAVGGHITAVTTAARVPAIVAQGAHLAAAAMWVGGLGVLAYTMAGVATAARPVAWRTAAAAFRPVATISAIVVIGTGVIASVREVQHRYFLLWSAYGRFLLAKWALVAGMLILGGLAGRALGARRTRGVPAAGDRATRTRPPPTTVLAKAGPASTLPFWAGSGCPRPWATPTRVAAKIRTAIPSTASVRSIPPTGFARTPAAATPRVRRAPSARPASPPRMSIAATSAHLARRNRPYADHRRKYRCWTSRTEAMTPVPITTMAEIVATGRKAATAVRHASGRAAVATPAMV